MAANTKTPAIGGKTEPLNPKTTEPDFFGIPGAIFITLTLPLFVYFLQIGCTPESCTVAGVLNIDWPAAIAKLRDLPLFDLKVFGVYLAWFFSLAACDLILPGPVAEGVVLRDGKTRLKYNLNGKTVMTTLAVILVARYVQTGGAMPELVYCYDHYVQIATSAILWAFIIATYVYAASFTHDCILSVGGNTGNPIFDWFIGRELNPRIGSFDIKYFCEMRPGLLLWAVLNLAMAHHEYITKGHVSLPMALVVLMEIYYVVEGNWEEYGAIHMMDITTDGFGFMLAFGDLAWVPFVYTVQARYLSTRTIEYPLWYAGIIVTLFATGYYIFRASNNEKNAFKHGDAPHLQYIENDKGNKLIVSGWWGAARHVNYLGDWLISWAWCLATGYESIFPYFFVAYFGALLFHREMRDDHKCALKYKELWVQYKKAVPSAIIPGVY